MTRRLDGLRAVQDHSHLWNQLRGLAESEGQTDNRHRRKRALVQGMFRRPWPTLAHPPRDRPEG